MRGVRHSGAVSRAGADSRPARRARAVLAVATVALLAAAPVACGGDDGGERTIDTGRPGDTDDRGRTIPVDDTTGSSVDPDDGSTGSSGGLPLPTTPDQSPLGVRLTAPDVLAPGLPPVDPGRGDGTFENDLCESVTIETTWIDSASQLLSDGTDPTSSTVAESILAFADDAAASGFVDAVTDGLATCVLDLVTEAHDVGDAAVVLRYDDGAVELITALVRVGGRVAAVRSTTPPGASPIDDSLLADLATRLAG